jgi:hypothetical protein
MRIGLRNWFGPSTKFKLSPVWRFGDMSDDIQETQQSKIIAD